VPVNNTTTLCPTALTFINNAFIIHKFLDSMAVRSGNNTTAGREVTCLLRPQVRYRNPKWPEDFDRDALHEHVRPLRESLMAENPVDFGDLEGKMQE
jgi:hypothetical protein